MGPSDIEARLRKLEQEVKDLRRRLDSLEQSSGRNAQVLSLIRGNVSSEK